MNHCTLVFFIWTNFFCMAGLQALARSQPKLTSIDLTASSVTDEGLKVLAQSCPQLRQVKLNSCRDVTGEGVAELLTYCPEIRELHLRSCDGLTDDGVCTFADRGERVTSIQIGGSWSSPLSDTALEAIARGCSGLESLRLQCIDTVTDDGIRQLVEACKSLRMMSIVSCESVTVEAVLLAKQRGIQCIEDELHDMTCNSSMNSRCIDLMCGACFRAGRSFDSPSSTLHHPSHLQMQSGSLEL